MTDTKNQFHNYKADMRKAKRASGKADRSDCSLLRTDPFITDLCYLSTSHSATDYSGRKIDQILLQESFGFVRLSASCRCSEGFDWNKNFPEIQLIHHNDLPGV